MNDMKTELNYSNNQEKKNTPFLTLNVDMS